MSRDARQNLATRWARAAFGEDHVANLAQRGVRLLEEAVELYQVAGGTPEMAHRLIDYIFARPAGALDAEIGGVGLTLLCRSGGKIG